MGPMIESHPGDRIRAIDLLATDAGHRWQAADRLSPEQIREELLSRGGGAQSPEILRSLRVRPLLSRRGPARGAAQELLPLLLEVNERLEAVWLTGSGRFSV